MAKLNKSKAVRTHEGAKGRAFTPEHELRRAVMSCMLWEDQFYEDGVSIADRIGKLVALVEPGFNLVNNPIEVADTFEVPLSFLMALKNHQRHAREWQGLTRHYYAIPYGERYIWGVTAGILRNLYDRIYRS